jgi:hypothetical protein
MPTERELPVDLRSGLAVVLAVDPGQTTGWATLTVDPARPECVPVVVDGGQVLTWGGFRDRIAGVTWVVYENWRLFPGSALAQVGSEMVAAQVIGVLLYLCEQAGIGATAQPALDNKRSFFNDVRLRENGYLDAILLRGGSLTRDRHEVDAIRHGMHFLHFTHGFAWDVSRTRDERAHAH